jgi:hypothetical protein
MYPFGKLYGGDEIVSGYDDTRGSFGYNISQWNSQPYVTNDTIHPFLYSETGLTDRDSLIYIAYNWSDDSISTNSLFRNGFAYFDLDSTRQQEDTLAPYEAKVYMVDTGSYTYNEAVTIIVTLTPTNITCNGDDDGAINASASGGTGPYTYDWTGPNGFVSSDQNISGLEPGLYTCVATDDNLDTGENSTTITEPTVILITGVVTDVSAEGESDGEIDVTISGGTPPYSYLWSPDSETTEDISSKAAGSYTITVTDDNSCEEPKLFTISTPTSETDNINSIINITTNDAIKDIDNSK